MKKNIKLFVNNNEESWKCAELAQRKLEEKGYKVVDNDDYEIAIAIGGDGSFIRMVNSNEFNPDLYYVGINAGHLGFLQEIKIDDIDKFIDELYYDKFKVENIGIQETTVNIRNHIVNHYSLNDVAIRDENLDLLKAQVYIDGYYLESFAGDGMLISTSVGSTAHSLGYGGSIVFPDFSTLQITPMAPINSMIYKPLNNSIVVPGGKVINVVPENELIRLTVDGKHRFYGGVNSIESTIGNKHIRCLRFSHYNFPQKVNEKLLSK